MRKHSELKKADNLALANVRLDCAFHNYFKKRDSFPKLKNKKSM